MAADGLETPTVTEDLSEADCAAVKRVVSRFGFVRGSDSSSSEGDSSETPDLRIADDASAAAASCARQSRGSASKGKAPSIRICGSVPPLAALLRHCQRPEFPSSVLWVPAMMIVRTRRRDESRRIEHDHGSKHTRMPHSARTMYDLHWV